MPSYLTCGLVLVVVGMAMMTCQPTASTIVQLAVAQRLGAGRWAAATVGDRGPLVLGGALAAVTVAAWSCAAWNASRPCRLRSRHPGPSHPLCRSRTRTPR